jgi:hypothetical protein
VGRGVADAGLTPCPECRGLSIEFRGTGLEMEHRICSRWRDPGHLTAKEIHERLREVRAAVRPSGRFA